MLESRLWRKPWRRKALGFIGAAVKGLAMPLPSAPAHATYTFFLVFPNRGNLGTGLVFPGSCSTMWLSNIAQELVYVYGQRSSVTVFLGYSYIRVSSVLQTYGFIPGAPYYNVQAM
jgi:hypothetical protein